MIHVVCQFLSAEFKLVGSIKKEFVNQGEFNSWYRVAKADPYMIIEVMIGYNPENNASLKSVYDATLYGLARNMEM